LEAVFERLTSAGLRVNREKCQFAVKRIDFLGFQISADGRQPSSEKTEAMRSFPTPTSAKDVQRFIGLTNYFRSLIPDYAQIAAPLYGLLKPKIKFEWRAEHDAAFRALREKMSAEPVVSLPDLNRPFIVKTEDRKSVVQEER